MAIVCRVSVFDDSSFCLEHIDYIPWSLPSVGRIFDFVLSSVLF